jgi:hypothetical protein
MTKETGGPAFPDGSHNQWGNPINSGMTLRDYFAAKAMQTLLQTNNGAVGVNRYEHRIAETAYAVADAMLKARER